jgi:hypothetical protein
VNTPLPDLGDLLHDAVDGIEPADRIEAIRARTAAGPARRGRRWRYAAGGVALAVAATVAAFAIVDEPPSSEEPGVASSAPPTPGTQLVPAYFIGDTPDGPRLFREFDRVVGLDAVQGALDRIQQPPSDPDYSTPWQPGSFGDATVRSDGIDVEVGSAALDDALAVQQVVFTVQGAAGQRLPVHFLVAGQRVSVGGRANPALLSPVVTSDPSEGLEVHDRFTARGAAGRFVREVRWELRGDDGTVASGTVDAHVSWHAQIDVRGLPFGFYTFVATAGRSSDTRTIIVR